jgi:hypothetical protein
MKDLIKYSEFTKRQATWIQVEYRQQREISRKQKGYYDFPSIKEFCLELYQEYLTICGVKDQKIFEKITEYQIKISSYYGAVNNCIDLEIYNNLNSLMDNLISNE